MRLRNLEAGDIVLRVRVRVIGILRLLARIHRPRNTIRIERRAGGIHRLTRRRRRSAASAALTGLPLRSGVSGQCSSG